MDQKKVFNILGIATTKDMKEIKRAYREKLVHLNPEDDPEGFKALREAYEEAIRLIDVEEEHQTQDTPITVWIKKAEELYGKLSTRINIACWKELLDEDICNDFDTASEAGEALLAFLMGHYRLPKEVWQLIEDQFHYKDLKEALYEKFPVDFVDFIAQDVESKGWLDFSLFEGEEEADIDEFINLYLRLRDMNDRLQYENIEEVLGKLEEIKLWHPFLEADKMRYLIANGKIDEAKESGKVLWSKNSHDLYIKYCIAQMHLESGELDRGYELCQEILEVNLNYYGAKALICDYHMKKEEYKKANEGYLELLEEDPYNDHLFVGLQKVNEKLIIELKEQVKKERKNIPLKLDLGWCYFQNRLYKECIDLLEKEKFKVDDVNYYNYYNLISRAYVETGEYKKTISCGEKWIAEILRTKDDGTKEAARRLRRLGLAYHIMSRCYYELNNLQKSLHYVDLAIKSDENIGNSLGYMSEKARILLKMEEDKLAIDVCDEILRQAEGYFPAYLIRQEAHFNLNMPHEVIEDYFKAIAIYNGVPSPYIFAAKVYINYNQFSDAEAVFKRAQEAGVVSNELRLLELKNRRFMASSNEEKVKIIEELDQLYEACQVELGDLREITEILFAKAACYYEIGQFQTALEIIEKKLRMNKDYESMVLKGDILYYLEEEGKAINVYKEIVKFNPNYSNLYYKIGLCYRAINMEEEEIRSYWKLEKYNPQHPYVNHRLMEIYKKYYLENYNEDNLNFAIRYGKRQVEVNPHYHDYMELGEIYLEAYQLEEAIKTYEEASKHDQVSPYPYINLANIHRLLEDSGKANEYSKRAVEHVDGNDLSPYWCRVMFYLTTEEYEKVIEILQMLHSKGYKPSLVNKKLLEVYIQINSWDRALDQIERMKYVENEEVDYLMDKGDIYSVIGAEDEALECYELAIKKASLHSKPYTKMGNYMLWIARDLKKALKYFKKAYKLAKKLESFQKTYKLKGKFEVDNEEDTLHDIITVLKEMGKVRKGKGYLKKIHKLYGKKYGSTEASLNNPKYRRKRLYQLAVSHYNVGQYDEAHNYMNRMKDSLRCYHCTYKTCYEYLELEGRMLELQNQYREALEKYQEALEISPSNIYYGYKIRELNDKVGVMQS